MSAKEPSSLLEAIVRISNFSYEPSMKKFSFLKKYLEKEKNPKDNWVLWMTTAGAGYALSKKEAYPGEHDELIKSLAEMKPGGIMVSKLVGEFAVFMQNTYEKDKKLYPYCIGTWVLKKTINYKPTTEEFQVFCQTVGELFNLTISEYENEKLKK